MVLSHRRRISILFHESIYTKNTIAESLITVHTVLFFKWEFSNLSREGRHSNCVGAIQQSYAGTPVTSRLGFSIQCLQQSHCQPEKSA